MSTIKVSCNWLINEGTGRHVRPGLSKHHKSICSKRILKWICHNWSIHRAVIFSGLWNSIPKDRGAQIGKVVPRSSNFPSKDYLLVFIVCSTISNMSLMYYPVAPLTVYILFLQLSTMYLRSLICLEQFNRYYKQTRKCVGFCVWVCVCLFRIYFN